MNCWKQLAAVAAVTVFGVSGVQAGVQIECGNPGLGIRTTTVNPALSCTFAGLDNLGDPQLVALLDSLIGGSAPSTLVERDAANSNGGDLTITGVGGPSSGTWSFDPTVWDDYGRVFLWFHFGDAQDAPGTTSTTDPDVFIVELMAEEASGSWSFPGTEAGAKLTGLSNVALLGADANGGGGGSGNGNGNGNSNGNGGGGGENGNGNGVPEPATLALVGLGLLGVVAARRRLRI